jgi:DNA-binding CsgD family transcriptional regulator
MWLIALAFLRNRQAPSPGLFYFALLTAGVMLMVLCEGLGVYCDTNRVHASTGFEVGLRVSSAAGKLLQCYAVVRLGYAVVRKSPGRRAYRIHLGLLVGYAAAMGVTWATGHTLVADYVFIGLSHLWVFALVWRYRGRMLGHRLRRFVYQLSGLALVFESLIVLAAVTRVAGEPNTQRASLVLIYILAAELLIAVHATKAYFAPRPATRRELGRGHAIGDGRGFSADIRLSTRELEIAELLAKGFTNKEIAAILSISDKTVTNHLYHMYKKLEVGNRVEFLAELGYYRSGSSK